MLLASDRKWTLLHAGKKTSEDEEMLRVLKDELVQMQQIANSEA